MANKYYEDAKFHVTCPNCGYFLHTDDPELTQTILQGTKLLCDKCGVGFTIRMTDIYSTVQSDKSADVLPASTG